MSDGHAHAAPLHGGPHAHEHHPMLQHQFDNMEQQAEASSLGMWVFLATEIMFFGGLFMAYLAYRFASPEGFRDASHHLDVALGTLNTAVLICSSLTMALAVRAAQTNERPRTQVTYLAITILLGLVFLGIKGVEYYQKFRDSHVPGPNFHWDGAFPGPAEMFYSLYFAMTGLHALHMIIGVSLMSVILWMAARGRFTSEYYTPLEVSGLYWHFVDIVWIFLFPLLYLIGRH